MALQPREISPAYVNHIDAARNIVGAVDKPLFISVAQDWCYDPLHTNRAGFKIASLGVVVAGGGARRVSDNDIGLKKPYEFMQQAAELNTGSTVQVVYNVHDFCGELFIHGATTLDQQKAAREEAWSKWDEAYKRLRSKSPADAKKIILSRSVGKSGSAPVLRQKHGSEFEIANPIYAKNQDLAQKYPLTKRVGERLIASQRAKLEEMGVVFADI